MFGLIMIFFCFKGEEYFFTLGTFKRDMSLFMFGRNVSFCMICFTKSLVTVGTDSSVVLGFLFFKRMMLFFSSCFKFVQGLFAESTHFMKFEMVTVMEK